MKRLFLVLVCLAVWSVPSTAQNDNSLPQPTLTGMIEAAATADHDANFTTLYTALQAVEYDTMLDTIGPLTLLAPTDNAFDDYFEQQNISREDLLEDNQRLKQLLLYHMLPGNFLLEHLHRYPGDDIATAYAGTTVTFRFEDNNLVRLGYVNGSSILAGDASARNGTIHIISDVLTAPDNGGSLDNLLLLQHEDTLLLDMLEADGTYQTFLNALDIANLPYQYISSGLPVTVFVPDDNGFQRYLEEQNTDPDRYFDRTHYLTRQMAYHIVPLPFTRENLLQLDGARIGTYLNGEALTVRVDDDTILIDDTHLKNADRIAGNGIQHTLAQPLTISEAQGDADMLPVLPVWVQTE
jgi:uncharacterized surface protein with fasciclin (FAS1) repeats